MCKREGIFFSVMILWLLMLTIEITMFSSFAKEYGAILNIVPILILLIIIIPRYFSRTYNNWLESGLNQKK